MFHSNGHNNEGKPLLHTKVVLELGNGAEGAVVGAECKFFSLKSEIDPWKNHWAIYKLSPFSSHHKGESSQPPTRVNNGRFRGNGRSQLSGTHRSSVGLE